MQGPKAKAQHAFTLVELMVVVAVLAVLAVLAAPSLRELIVMQRLKSINAELVTDLQYARSEAIARNRQISVRFGSSSTMTCYVVFIDALTGSCDCTQPPGSVCNGVGVEEIRTTQVPASTDVQVAPVAPTPAVLSFSREGMRPVNTDYVVATTRRSGGNGRLQITVNAMGRPTVCSQEGSVSGFSTCPSP
jgi:type IV fimbrial biogenesis protein FimT